MKKLVLLSVALIGFIICSTSIVDAQGVGINSSGNQPDPSAMIDVSSTTKGALIPRMTTTQRDAITNPALALQIFNITTNCLEIFVSGAWYLVSCPCPFPGSFSATAVSGITQIAFNANWSASP